MDLHKCDQTVLHIACSLEQLLLCQLYCLFRFPLSPVKECEHWSLIHSRIRYLRQQFLCPAVVLFLNVIGNQHIKGTASYPPIRLTVHGNPFK